MISVSWLFIYVNLKKKINIYLNIPFALRVLTGSLDFDQITRFFESKFFFKSKRHRFSKKIKINGLQPDLAGSTGSPSHFGFFLFLFFLQPGPVPAPDRPDPRSTYPDRILKLWVKMTSLIWWSKLLIIIIIIIINDKARLSMTQPSYFDSFELFFFLLLFYSILFPLNFRYRYPMRLLRKLTLFMVSYIKYFPWLYIFKFF